MTCDFTRLRETLGKAELQRLVRRLRVRLERGQELRGTMALPSASPEERAAINRLLGRTPTRGNAISISLDLLSEKLRLAGICRDLREAVEELTGPVTDLRSERETIEKRWTTLFDLASKRVAGWPELENWLTQIRASGLMRRHGMPTAEILLPQALDVMESLPARDVTLAEFAAAKFGDAHALDPDTALGSIVIRAVASFGKLEKWDDAQSRREAWASVGIICDELSAPVLVLNLRASDDQPASRALAAYADAGEPTFLSIRQLLRAPPRFTRESVGPVVYVCENPSIVAAAANRLGARGLPLVCVEGQPRTATRLLLNRLTSAGIRLTYHGDFDWAGIQIANTIIARHNAAPWRMRANDYLEAATRFLTLSGTPVAASWDNELMPAMLSNGRVVHEEQVIEAILTDLAPR
jgi:uncharacterized protein (TIGR02679 family)